MDTTITAAIWTICGLLLTFAESCSPPEGPVPPNTIERRIHFADVVAYGKVLAHHEDNKHEHQTSSMFTAEMELFCTYKGDRLKKYVNVTGAGHVPGLCHFTRLQVGKTYVVLMNTRNGNLEPVDQDIEIKNNKDEKLVNVSNVCDLKLKYPKGITLKTAKRKCPKPANDKTCVLYVEPPAEPEPEIEAVFDEVVLDMNTTTVDPNAASQTFHDVITTLVLLVFSYSILQ